MGENAIVLKSVENLQGKNFFIPSYQRGYRWKEQQVKDLLNDIDEFIKQQEKSEKNDGFYCIQPLVVKENIAEAAKTGFIDELKNIETDKDVLAEAKKAINKYTKWEVIDGQQRLTTIFILLSFLGVIKPYKLEYETRKGTGSDEKVVSDAEKLDVSKIGSFKFLENFFQLNDKDEDFQKSVKENIKKEAEKNIDFYHMYNAYHAIEDWFGANKTVDKSRFKETLLKQVKFIWYESTDEDPIKVFTRLNIGKISLTNAELIKALFLNRSNFSENNDNIRLKQQEIASEWDKIEYTLQNEEFWLFLNQLGYDKPTRIDMIFDLISEQDILGIGEQNIGTDQYKTFRYFYQYFKSDSASIIVCWSKVKNVFQIFEEWYNDLELYHYVGYLVDQGEKISKLVELWKNSASKLDFIGKLKAKIIGKIKNCNDLCKEYETSGNLKTQCSPLLLLHNIQTVINQNKNSEDAYKLPVFYKFPFHLYKSEKWDVEHIDSNTENDLEDLDSQKEWLKDISLDIPNDKEEVLEKIRNFIQKSTSDEKSQDRTFKKLCKEVKEYASKDTDRLQKSKNKDEKNLIWNYCLLDRSTNRGYGNAIFSVKRRIIIAKDQGKTFVIKDDLSLSLNDGAIAFVLPCTKNVFLKYYNPSTNVLRAWTKADAEAYRDNILETLKDFGVKMNEEETINEQ